MPEMQGNRRAFKKIVFCDCHTAKAGIDLLARGKNKIQFTAPRTMNNAQASNIAIFTLVP
jgi:hypothetical protein